MNLFLATGEALDASELIDADLLIEWYDPTQAWEGKKGELPSTKRCYSRGRLLGVRDGPVGPELALAQEDDEDGNWGKAMAIPACVVGSITKLVRGEPMYRTRTLQSHTPDCAVSVAGARHGCTCGLSGPRVPDE